MIGAIIAYGFRHPLPAFARRSAAWNHALSIAGLLLLVAGIASARSDQPFPGWQALLPTVGTGLLITASASGAVNRWLLSQTLLVGIGLISYPLYLWHVVLLVMARIAYGGTPPVSVVGGLVALSFLLAWATFRFVERPLRFGGHATAKAWGLVAGLGVVATAALLISTGDGVPSRSFPSRYSAYTSTMTSSAAAQVCKDVPFGYSRANDWYCTLGPTDPTGPAGAPAIVAYGDSHALNVLPALERYADARGVTIRFVSTSGCPPLLGVQSMRGDAEIELHNCRALNERIWSMVRVEKISTVLLAGRWTVYTGNPIVPNEFSYLAVDDEDNLSRASSATAFAHGLAETIARYHAIGARVLLVEDSAQQLMRPRDALRRAGMDDEAINRLAVTRARHVESQTWVRDRLEAAGADGLLAVDDALCDVRCDLVRDGRFLYFDDDHLSASGSLLLLPALSTLLDRFTAPRVR